jgi:hypothetical protein
MYAIVKFDNGTRVCLWGKALRDLVATLQREEWKVEDKPIPKVPEK